jgi:hypothetical protein
VNCQVIEIIRWGTVPDWVGSVSTFLALVGAGIAPAWDAANDIAVLAGALLRDEEVPPAPAWFDAASKAQLAAAHATGAESGRAG